MGGWKEGGPVGREPSARRGKRERGGGINRQSAACAAISGSGSPKNELRSVRPVLLVDCSGCRPNVCPDVVSHPDFCRVQPDGTWLRWKSFSSNDFAQRFEARAGAGGV